MTRIGTRYTHEFVAQNLPPDTPRILEIGCGDGELAALLLNDGFEVVGIDNDPAAIASARALGIEAWETSWPTTVESRFDAILFTRSLHHIHELDDAVAAAREALRPDGRIIVEDFRAEGGSEQSFDWFAGLVRLLNSIDAFTSDFDAEAWIAALRQVNHEHELHSSRAIADALACAGKVELSNSAYYFRYLEPNLKSSDTAKLLLEHELTLIETQLLDALGKRFVVSR